MNSLVLNQDIKSMSDFRSNVSGFINQVHTTKRPIVITQHGKSSVVLLDVTEYDKIVEKMEMIEDIEIASMQIESGNGIPHKQALKQLKKRLAR